MGGFQRLSQAHGLPTSNHTSMSGAPEHNVNMMNVPLNFQNNMNMQQINLMRAPFPVSTLLAPNHLASYHTVPTTSIPRPGQLWTPHHPHPGNLGINENAITYQPTLLTPVMPVSSASTFQDSNVSKSSNLVTSEINNNNVAGKPCLDPKAKEFRPTSESGQLSVAVPEFKPNTPVQNTLPPSKTQQINVFEQKVKSVFPLCPQNPHMLKPVSISTIKKALGVKSSKMKSLCDRVNAETQTTLTGLEMEEQLCDKCSAILTEETTCDVVPILFKMKDISMQHKLKYLVCKAAVFVRESQTILTQPHKFKSKLLNRLNKMCSYFGAESSKLTIWQDDIACTIAINLLTEDPELSSSQKSTSFLQQLKEEMESHMEIAQDILNIQKNPIQSNPDNIVLDKDSHTEIAGELSEVVSKSTETVSCDNFGSENLLSPRLVSVAMTFPGELNTNRNDLVTGSTLDVMPSVNLSPTLTANNNALLSNLYMGSALNSSALNSNFQVGSSGFEGIGFNSNVDHVTMNSASNSMNVWNRTSHDLLQMQQDYLQMLTCMNSLKTTTLPSVTATTTELSSDKFVSEISQNLCEFRIDSYPPSQASPSLSIEDDVSVALSKTSQERVRHLSSSTNNSDSDRNMKKKSHHSQESTTTTGVKKLPLPLDFRSHKSTKNSNLSHASSVVEKPVSDIDSHLSALYKSFISQSVDDSTTSQMTTNKAQISSNIDSIENVTTSSSEMKPLRHLTPLQRKRLKKNDGLTHGEVKETISMLQNLPKTVESEELQSLESCHNTASFAQGEVTLRNPGKEMDEWNSFPEHSGDTHSKYNMDFLASFESDHIHCVKDSKDVAITQGLGKEKTLWNSFINNPRHDTDLGAISRDLCQVLTSHFNSQRSKNEMHRDLSSPESLPQSDNENEENHSSKTISGSSEENNLDVTSPLNQLQNDIEPAEKFTSTSLPSKLNLTPAIRYSHSLPDTASSLAENILDGDVHDYNNPLSYSSIVKQKLSTLSAKTKITEDIMANNEFELSFSGSYPSLNGPTLYAQPLDVPETDKIQSDTPIPSNDAAVGGRTWSSLFRSNGQRSNKAVTASKEEVKTHGESKSFDDLLDRTIVERDCDITLYDVKGFQKFGNYGLDDFSTTPPSLKHKETRGHRNGVNKEEFGKNK